MKKQILIATGNQGKLKEFKDILKPLNLQFLTPQEAGVDIEVKETGNAYSENALLKAEAYLQSAKLPVISDDSGLEVQALEGAPGLYSARFSPKENASDADRRQYLIQQLSGKPHPWKARFWCTAVLALPDGRYFTTTGHCDGVIIQEERGAMGFGYDPIFYLPEYRATMAELGPEIKNKISHRARALQTMIPIFKRVFEI